MPKTEGVSQQREVAAAAAKQSRVQEKRIDIPMVDNKEFRWKLKVLVSTIAF